MDQLEALQNKLQGKEDSLRIREQRVNELEGAIARKDSAMNYLRNSIANALTGFEGKGLTIYTKNGQVYVSMENSLLFQHRVVTRFLNAVPKRWKILPEC